MKKGLILICCHFLIIILGNCVLTLVQVILGAGSPCAWQGMISSLPNSCRYSALGDTRNNGGSYEGEGMLMTNPGTVQICGLIYKIYRFQHGCVHVPKTNAPRIIRYIEPCVLLLTSPFINHKLLV